MSAADLYHVYGHVTDFKNFQGNPMPAWDDLPSKIKEAWQAVADHKKPPIVLTETETALIAFARAYIHLYADAAIPGRNLILLIARLAEALET